MKNGISEIRKYGISEKNCQESYDNLSKSRGICIKNVNNAQLQDDLFKISITKV